MAAPYSDKQALLILQHIVGDAAMPEVLRTLIHGGHLVPVAKDAAGNSYFDPHTVEAIAQTLTGNPNLELPMDHDNSGEFTLASEWEWDDDERHEDLEHPSTEELIAAYTEQQIDARFQPLRERSMMERGEAMTRQIFESAKKRHGDFDEETALRVAEHVAQQTGDGMAAITRGIEHALGVKRAALEEYKSGRTESRPPEAGPAGKSYDEVINQWEGGSDDTAPEPQSRVPEGTSYDQIVDAYQDAADGGEI